MSPAAPRGRSMRAALGFVALVAAGLAGCLGDDDDDPRAVIVEPLHAARTGAALDLHVRTDGLEGVVRLGVAWASAPTRAIPADRLTEAAFDGVLWTGAGSGADATIRIDRVPAVPELYLRGVAEANGEVHWSEEIRVLVAPAPPPIELDVRLTGVPAQAYPRQILSFTLNATGGNNTADEAGLAWGWTSRLGRDAANLTLADYAERERANGTLRLPLTYDFEDWSTTRNESVYLRAWVRLADILHWSREHRLDMTQPPIVDLAATSADHVVRIEPGLVPIPVLAAFTPANVTIKVGESLQWENHDDATHTASHVPDEGAEAAFHTGSVAAGSTSTIYRFLVPGEYAYECRIHPDTMQGTIHVDA